MLQRPDSIAHNTLERYTNTPLEQFGSFLLRTNFRQYANAFAARFGVEVQGGTWANAHAPGENLSLIDFGIGSPMAGLVMDVISHTDPSAVLMLGLCGGTDDDLEVGECVVPTASIRDEGPSAHYLPPTVPALPSLALNATICQALDNSSIPHRSGIMKTTDYRMWEFDEAFKAELRDERVIAIDMEIATLFAVGYAKAVPTGALMLVSDLPLRKGGIKTKESGQSVLTTYAEQHLNLGIDVMTLLKQRAAPSLRTEWCRRLLGGGATGCGRASWSGSPRDRRRWRREYKLGDSKTRSRSRRRDERCPRGMAKDARDAIGARAEVTASAKRPVHCQSGTGAGLTVTVAATGAPPPTRLVADRSVPPTRTDCSSLVVHTISRSLLSGRW